MGCREKYNFTNQIITLKTSDSSDITASLAGLKDDYCKVNNGALEDSNCGNVSMMLILILKIIKFSGVIVDDSCTANLSSEAGNITLE